METLLMVATVVAFALAIGMSVLAWRLLRENRQRSHARVEALQAMASSSEPPARFATLDDEDVRDDLEDAAQDEALGSWDLGLSQAGTGSGAGRRLQAASRSPQPAVRRQPTDARKPSPEVTFGAGVQVHRGAPPRRWLALAMVGLLMAAAVSSVYALYRPVIAAESGGAIDAPRPRNAGPKPLELLSLRHSVDPNGAFTVTGLVQNPADGQTSRQIVAVVYLFDRDGNYFAGGKAALDFAVLQPGDESPFVVHIPSVGRVSRYRVGFRSEGGGIVAHVDRRGQLPGGMTGDAIDGPASQHSAVRRPEGRP
jgi:hypothetical protein